MLNANSVINLLEMCEQNDVEFIDFRFTDMFGKVHHTTRVAGSVSEATFTDGVMFDGSSILGWREINESDMIMMPDFTTAFLDPFTEYKTAIIFCYIVEPKTGLGYNRDPMGIGLRAEEYLSKSDIGDVAYFGPELEFFVFDDVRYQTGMYGSNYVIDSTEFPTNNAKDVKGMANLGHRPAVKGRGQTRLGYP